MKKIFLIILCSFLLFSCQTKNHEEEIVKLQQRIQELQQDNKIKCLEQSGKAFELATEWVEIKNFESAYKNDNCYMQISMSSDNTVTNTIIDVYANKTLAEKYIWDLNWCFTPEKSIDTCVDTSYNAFYQSIFNEK